MTVDGYLVVNFEVASFLRALVLAMLCSGRYIWIRVQPISKWFRVSERPIQVINFDSVIGETRFALLG